MSPESPELLRGLSSDLLQQTLALGSRISLPSGAELFSLGSAADRLYIIERGRVKLTLPMNVRGHQEDILVEERMPGQTIGWSALIPPYRFTLKATTLLETELVAISREVLTELFAHSPGIGFLVTMNLAALIGQRLQLFQAMWIREMERVVEMRHA